MCLLETKESLFMLPKLHEVLSLFKIPIFCNTLMSATARSLQRPVYTQAKDILNIMALSGAILRWPLSLTTHSWSIAFTFEEKICGPLSNFRKLCLP